MFGWPCVFVCKCGTDLPKFVSHRLFVCGASRPYLQRHLLQIDVPIQQQQRHTSHSPALVVIISQILSTRYQCVGYDSSHLRPTSRKCEIDADRKLKHNNRSRPTEAGRHTQKHRRATRMWIKYCDRCRLAQRKYGWRPHTIYAEIETVFLHFFVHRHPGTASHVLLWLGSFGVSLSL